MTDAASTTDLSRRDAAGTSTTQRLAGMVGAVFLVVGIAGFIPGITENLDGITFAGNESDAQLLGIFEVSVLHNLVHLLFGIVGLAAARAWDMARNFLIVGGFAYLAMWLYGMVVDEMSDVNFVPFNDADTWLHFALGALMLALGLITGRRGDETATATRSG